MYELIEVKSEAEIFPKYRDTPIADLMLFHNLEVEFKSYKKAELLIGMCMDLRKHLNIPRYFAFIMRDGGANFKFSEFKISFAIGVGGISYFALIGHTNCGMCHLQSKKEDFVKGLVEFGGWNEKDAIAHFEKNEPIFEIHDEIKFTVSETERLRKIYPKITIAPMMYDVATNKLSLIKE